jgi:hypothetical protein
MNTQNTDSQLAVDYLDKTKMQILPIRKLLGNKKSIADSDKNSSGFYWQEGSLAEIFKYKT